jgi:hypothetical protein
MDFKVEILIPFCYPKSEGNFIFMHNWAQHNQVVGGRAGTTPCIVNLDTRCVSCKLHMSATKPWGIEPRRPLDSIPGRAQSRYGQCEGKPLHLLGIESRILIIPARSLVNICFSWSSLIKSNCIIYFVALQVEARYYAGAHWAHWYLWLTPRICGIRFPGFSCHIPRSTYIDHRKHCPQKAQALWTEGTPLKRLS